MNALHFSLHVWLFFLQDITLSVTLHFHFVIAIFQSKLVMQLIFIIGLNLVAM